MIVSSYLLLQSCGPRISALLSYGLRKAVVEVFSEKNVSVFFDYVIYRLLYRYIDREIPIY